MSEEKDDYSYWSEVLHSSYLFYTMEVDRLNKQLQTAKEENERLRNLLGKPYKRSIDLENNKLTQQNKQMREALEFIKTKYEPYIAYLQVVEDINKIMTALKGGE